MAGFMPFHFVEIMPLTIFNVPVAEHGIEYDLKIRNIEDEPPQGWGRRRCKFLISCSVCIQGFTFMKVLYTHTFPSISARQGSTVLSTRVIAISARPFMHGKQLGV